MSCGFICSLAFFALCVSEFPFGSTLCIHPFLSFRVQSGKMTSVKKLVKTGVRAAIQISSSGQIYHPGCANRMLLMLLQHLEKCPGITELRLYVRFGKMFNS